MNKWAYRAASTKSTGSVYSPINLISVTAIHCPPPPFIPIRTIPLVIKLKNNNQNHIGGYESDYTKKVLYKLLTFKYLLHQKFYHCKHRVSWEDSSQFPDFLIQPSSQCTYSFCVLPDIYGKKYLMCTVH